MKNLLRDMPLFVEVARQKNFTAAADILEMPVSTLSRRIAAMEKHLGLPLFNRNSRNVELTDSGKIFYERCDFIVADALDALDAVTQNMNKPSGWVRFSVPGDVYMSFFADSLSAFAKKWPEIHLSIHFSDRAVDLLTEPFDLDLRVGDLPDSSLKARRIASGRPAIYASPKLLEKYFVPKKPEDLKKLPCITYSQWGSTWNLSKNGKNVAVSLQPVHAFNSFIAPLNFILNGSGLASLPPKLANPIVKKGELVQVLPDWHLPTINAYLVMASSQVPRQVRLLIEHLVEYSAANDGKVNMEKFSSKP